MIAHNPNSRCHQLKTAPLKLLRLTALVFLLLLETVSAIRDVTSLTKWATNEGVYLHPAVRWKEYGNSDWGMVLADHRTVERGTILLKVPRSLVLDSTVLRKEEEEENGAKSKDDCAEVVKDALGEFALHEENFWIVLRLYRLKCHQMMDPNHRFAPYVDAMPNEFPEFTREEMECLPFYARYAAQYQEKKFDAFCHAVETLMKDNGEDENKNKGGKDDDADVSSIGFSTQNAEDVSTFKWAFRAVNSRFWKTNPPPELNMEQTSELVPFGDMMNHRDPPNVQMVPLPDSTDHVCFAYLGDDNDDGENDDDDDDDDDERCYERDLFLSYGQPCNPHRFLVIFGFVPNAQYMPNVWSHLAYPDTNPYGSSAQADQMTFDANDGTVSQNVWDAIQWELLQPSSKEKFDREKDAKHVKYKDIIVGVLESHLDRQLEELAGLRTKIEACTQKEVDGGDVSNNMDMIRRYNEFLTEVFTKVKGNLRG